MTTISSEYRTAGALPAINFNTLGLMFISGFFATIAFDVWGQIVSPGLGYANLSPHGLARSLLANLGLPSNDFAGYFVHFYLVGLVGYPIGWMFIFAPLWQRVFGTTHWLLPAALYGFGLWIFAIGGITALAGLPFFLKFTGITWVALAGHVLYGIVLVATLKLIEGRQSA
ncbi:hypothetical protein [Roseibium sp.]|uniref:hypothetical protein n=1 Tax=Roseibium sp. TaxID=1936156 RepID=UPI003D0B17A0